MNAKADTLPGADFSVICHTCNADSENGTRVLNSFFLGDGIGGRQEGHVESTISVRGCKESVLRKRRNPMVFTWSHDRYGRYIADLVVGERYINRALVEKGVVRFLKMQAQDGCPFTIPESLHDVPKKSCRLPSDRRTMDLHLGDAMKEEE